MDLNDFCDTRKGLNRWDIQYVIISDKSKVLPYSYISPTMKLNKNKKIKNPEKLSAQSW